MGKAVMGQFIKMTVFSVFFIAKLVKIYDF